MTRSKYDAIMEEFPFLRWIVGPTLRSIIEKERCFLVRRMREDKLFWHTGKADEKEMWVVYTSSSCTPYSFAAKLPPEQPLWAVFPPPNHAPGFMPSREFVAVVKVMLRDSVALSVTVWKIPREVAAKQSLFDTLYGIRRVAGWPQNQITDYPVDLPTLPLGVTNTLEGAENPA